MIIYNEIWTEKKIRKKPSLAAQLSHCSRKDFVSYFQPMRVICPIQPGRFSRANQGQEKPAKLSLPQHLASRTDDFLSTPFLAAVSLLLEESRLIYCYGTQPEVSNEHFRDD